MRGRGRARSRPRRSAPASASVLAQTSVQAASWGSPSGCYTAGAATGAGAGVARLAAAMCLRRIGFNTNQAISAATAFMMLATMNTACQPPVAAASTLDKGTSSEAVPFAVYIRPAFAAAYSEPNVSVVVDGNRL